jgi:hypothetical protein
MTVDYSAAALAAARRYCGWVVTPPETVTLLADGPGGRVLSLPTMQLTTVTAITEDDVALDVADLRWSVNRGLVYKKSGRCWTCNAGGLEVTMTHGYATAPDFEAAVEQAATALSSAATRDEPSLKRKRIDDVEYEWFEMATTFLNTALLAPYRILPLA